MNENVEEVENKKQTNRAVSNKRGQEGYGVIIVIVLIFLFFVMVVAGVSTSMKASQSQENTITRNKEKWEARSGLSTLKRVLEVRLPLRYQSDVQTAQNCLRDGGQSIGELKSFDDQSSLTGNSNPVLNINEDGTTDCQTVNETAFTSLLGKSDGWAAKLGPLWKAEAVSFGYEESKINIASLKEVLRQFSTDGEPAYQFGYVIDARGGQHFRDRKQGEIYVGGSSLNCGATGRLSISPLTVQRGSPITLTVVYTNVNRLRFFDGANTLIHEATVTEDAAPQTYNWSYTPTATDSYRVEALSSNNECYSRSESIPVTVTEQPAARCPVIDSFVSSADTVNQGESVTLSWIVRDAAEVRLEGETVSLTGSKDFVILADRNFTLVARDTANNCPASRTVPVRVRPNVCAFGTPQIPDFRATPPSIITGGTSTLSWNITGLEAGGTVRLTGNGIDQTVNASGTQPVTPPNAVGDYTYTLITENVCPDGTRLTNQKQVIISVRDCPPPVINSFTANPNSVAAGGNQTVRLNWSISGVADVISISGIGNVSGGFLDIQQPNTTTDYILTVTGCSQSPTAQTRVTVIPIPVTFTRTDAGLFYYDNLGDYTAGSYTYAKGISIVSFNNATGELIYDAVEYGYFQQDGSSLPSFYYNQGNQFYPSIVNNNDPCFNAGGQPRPGCIFTLGLTAQLISSSTSSGIPVVTGRFRVFTTPGSGVPYIEFSAHNYRYGNEETYHN